MVGDIVIYRASSSKYVVYLYAGGDTLYVLSTASDDTMQAEKRMQSLLGRYTYETANYYFAVLRPSLVQE